jgi:polyhydroxyalkanoate synthesis regulator phasin
MYHFGRCQYDTAKNIISESIKSQAAPIVDKLNSGEMTEDEAKKALDKIWY